MALMLIEFGPFVADTDRRELLKYGKRLRLRPQPFDILVALLDCGVTGLRSSPRQIGVYGNNETDRVCLGLI